MPIALFVFPLIGAIFLGWSINQKYHSLTGFIAAFFVFAGSLILANSLAGNQPIILVPLLVVFTTLGYLVGWLSAANR